MTPTGHISSLMKEGIFSMKEESTKPCVMSMVIPEKQKSFKSDSIYKQIEKLIIV